MVASVGATADVICGFAGAGCSLVPGKAVEASTSDSPIVVAVAGFGSFAFVVAIDNAVVVAVVAAAAFAACAVGAVVVTDHAATGEAVAVATAAADCIGATVVVAAADFAAVVVGFVACIAWPFVSKPPVPSLPVPH